MTTSMFVLFLLYLGHIWSVNGQDVRIIDGEVSSSGQFPFAVAFYINTADGVKFCGGSLISDRWVLTAAHCLVSAEGFSVLVGMNKLDEATAIGTTRRASVYIMHPNYNQTVLHNDIGLIFLETPVVFTDTIQPVELPTESIGPNEKTVALGWGSVKNVQHLPSNALSHVNLTTISNAVCRRTYGGVIHKNIVCANGVGNQGICHGDSGGPLIQNQNGKVVQVGIVSFYSGTGCETEHPSGFTRTFEYLEWINNVTRSSSESIKKVNSLLLCTFVLFTTNFLLKK